MPQHQLGCGPGPAVRRTLRASARVVDAAHERRLSTRILRQRSTLPSRILHVIPALAPRYGGPSAACLGMCRALIELGTTVVVATTDADGSQRLPVTLGATQAYHEIPAIFFRRQASESFKLSRPLARWLDAHVTDFDLVHVHAVFSHSSIAAGRACRRHGVPYVVRPLGTLDPWSLGRHAWRKRLLLRLGARRLLSGASSIHYTTAEEGRLAEMALPWLPRSAVIPLGVDEDLFVKTAQSDTIETPPYVLTLSRLDPKKGIKLLIDAFHQVSGDLQRPWSLIVAGDGPPDYVARLREAAARGPAAPRIHFRGWVGKPERAALLRGASLFALPSHQENFGIAMVEALAAGVPVMVSPGVNLGSEIEAAGAGWVVSRDQDVWRRALGNVLADDQERTARACHAREYAQRFRWSRVASELRTLYDQLSTRRALVATS
ncbi:MAG: glycosyltransferase [Vicinamibacterales bacterium]